MWLWVYGIDGLNGHLTICKMLDGRLPMGNCQAALMGVVYDATDQDV